MVFPLPLVDVVELDFSYEMEVGYLAEISQAGSGGIGLHCFP